MKRRTEKRQAKKLRESVLKQMRETRAQLQKDHPGMFAALRALAAKANPQPQSSPPPESEQPEKEEKLSGEEEVVHIDRKKNLEAILKYAASNPDADLDALKSDLKKLLN